MGTPVTAESSLADAAQDWRGEGQKKRRALLRFVNIEGFLFVVGILLIWQLLVYAGALPNIYPSPLQIWNSAMGIVGKYAFSGPLLHTLLVTIVGWLIASGVGLVLGLLMGIFLPVWQYGMASIDVIRSIPAIVFVPVIALVFGITLKAEIIVIIYVSTWPMLLNTLAGVQHVGGGLRDAARMMHLSRKEFVWKIALPSAVPEILVGLRLSMALALTLSIVSELLINPAGLGFLLLQSEQNIEPRAMFVYVVAIGILGFLLNACLLLLTRLVLPRSLADAAVKQKEGMS